MKIKKQNPNELIYKALQNYAQRLYQGIASGNGVPPSKKEAQDLDRALRSLDMPGIDIAPVWVQWRYWGEPRGWLTNHELKRDYRTGRLYYPALDSKKKKE